MKETNKRIEDCKALIAEFEAKRNEISTAIESETDEDKVEALEDKIADIDYEIEDLNERIESLTSRKYAIEYLQRMYDDGGIFEIYRFIVSLHSCEGAAQLNIGDFANRLR